MFSLSRTPKRIMFFFIILTSIVLESSLVLSPPIALSEALSLPVLQESMKLLYPPYPGTTYELSIFDHSSPTYSVEDQKIVAFTADEAVFDPNNPNDVQCRNTWPTQYYSVSIGFCLSYNGHNGIDYGIDHRPILAAADANQVMRAGWENPQNHKQGFGLYISLHHTSGDSAYRTLYGHLAALAVQACPTIGCADLRHGDVIGVSGNTGNSSGPHLHFGTYTGGGQVFDPYGWTGTEADPYTKAISQDLWVQYPDVSGSGVNTVLPSGNALLNPLSLNGGMVVDDSNLDFSQEPVGCFDRTEPVNESSAIGGKMRYLASVITSGTANCTAKWSFPASLPAGVYDLYTHIPSNHATSEGAQYLIHHAGQDNVAIVNQAEFPAGDTADGWVFIGRHNFAADGAEYIALGNVTLDTTTSKELGVDAVQFVPIFNCPPGTEPGILSAHLDEQTGAVACDSSDRSSHSSGVSHNGAMTGATIIPDGQLKNARRFNQNDGLDKITFAASDDYHLANDSDNSLTADLWFRHDGSNTGERTLANALGTSSGIFGGWKLTFDPATREVKFTAYSGDKNSTTPTSVATTIASGFKNQWVHVKAIKDGTDEKLYLCTAVGNGQGMLSPGVSFSQGIHYWPGITLDLGIDYDGSPTTGWQGDLDEFVYKNVADKSGCTAGVGTATPQITATPIAQGILPSQENGGPAYVYLDGLQPGTTYRIIVTGTYYYGAYWGIADAQWSDWPSRDQCYCSSNRAIYFNGVPLEATDVSPADHNYTFLWTANSTQLQMYITDEKWSDNAGALNYTLFNDGDIYLSSTPAATSAGLTPTPVSAATPLPPCICVLEWLVGQCTPSSPHLASLARSAVYVWQQAAIDIQLFTHVRDDVLGQTPEGQRYIELYNLYSPEIINLLAADTALKDEAITLLQLWQPNLQVLVEGQGSTLTITAEQVQAVQTFLNHLAAASSPALQQAITEEQTQRPLEEFAGKTMSQAWTVINQPATATPTITFTATATPTLTETPIPTSTSTPTLTSMPTDDAPNSREAALQASPKNVNLRYFITPSSDEDWFRFELEQASSPQVYLSNLPTNYDLYVYTASGQLLGSSTKEGKAAEKITLTGAAPGDYYVRVIGVNGVSDASNSYQLRFHVPGIGGP